MKHTTDDRLLHRLARWFMMLCAVAAIAGAYREGVERKYDTRLTFGFEQDGWNMAIALSRLLFDFHKGYIGYRQVFDTAAAAVTPAGSGNPDNIKFLQSREAIDEALAQVQKIDRSTLPKYKYMTPEFVVQFAEDLGLADMFTLAYSIFGLHADSMYKMYFLIFSLSALLFIAEHRLRLGPLALLALLCGSFLLFIYSRIFDLPQMPSVTANRFAGTLGFIPILHLLCVMRAPDALTRRRILILCAQALIFTLAYSIRNTTKWELLLCLCVAAVAACLYWRRGLGFRRIIRQVPLAACLLFVSVFGVYNIAQYTQLNKIYKGPCNIPHHMTWHSIVLGLAFNMNWKDYHQEISPARGGDMLAWQAFERVMNARGEAYACPETGGYYKARIHEKVMRGILIDFALRHPRYMYELQFYHKPVYFTRHLKQMLGFVETWVWLAGAAASAVAGIVGGLIARGRRREVVPLLAVAGGGLVLSCLPFYIAYPTLFMVDVVWMLAINAALWIWALFYVLMPRLYKE